MKKGDTVYVKDTVGAPAGLSRGSKWIVKAKQRNGLTVSLEGWIGAPFSIHRFTTTPPRTKLTYHW